ncbi:MAG: C39 family peptidase [Clostridia bacterium]|nr:C39 family peptidase [Clostridia bacterium]
MKKANKAKFFAWFFGILSLLLVLVLIAAVFIIVKLNRNNMFSKSILLDNNYFMDYSFFENKEESENEEQKDVYVDGMVVREYIEYNSDGDAVIISTYVDRELKEYIDGIMSRLDNLYGGYLESIVIRNKIENNLYSIYETYGINQTGDEAAETYLLKQHDLTLSLVTGKVKLDIPYISQEGEFPNGCEAVSAVMLLQNLGFDIDPGEFIDEYLKCEETYIKWGCRYGPNPKKAYVGDPRDEDGGFGCFAPVIVNALNEYLPSEYTAFNTTGMSLNSLKSNFLDRGIPVAVWVTVEMEEIDKILQWQSYDKKETYLYPANEHCMVLIGYTDDTYIFADPYNSNGIVEYSESETVLAFNSLGMQSVVIVDSSSIN